MSLGNVNKMPCINAIPPADDRCSDPAFALANPNICPPAPTLVIRPEVLLICTLGSVQYTAAFIRNGVEEDVTDQCVWQSDDVGIAVVGASTGNVTGMSSGETTITATYQGLTATASLNVLGDGDCCEDTNIGIMVIVDKTRSMNQNFGGGYATKLTFAKAAARAFIDEVNTTKDTVGLMSFTDEGYVTHSALSADSGAVADLVDDIAQTSQVTSFYAVLAAAIEGLDSDALDRKVIVLISDGVDTDTSYGSTDNPIQLLSDFKSDGGIVICLGTRASGAGYSLLNAFATGGFFVNGYSSVASTAISYLLGLKGYICAGNCTPTGDSFENQGKANYSEFANWDVVDGHVDLFGPGWADPLPGSGSTNDLYVDMAGSKAEYNGKLLSKDGFSVVAGRDYRISVDLAGNQRINAATNTVKVSVFERNSDQISNPTNPASASQTQAGGGLSNDETYLYAYSYLNANGETELSPAVSVTVGREDTTVSLTIPVDDATATLIRVYRTIGQLGSTRFYMIGEITPSGGATETLNDTMRLADIIAAVADGTVDESIQAPTQNATGTPIPLISQSITINNFQQGWQTYSFAATAPNTGTVWISVEQITAPAGYEYIGLLLGRVEFKCTTTGEVLLSDNFDDENLTYIEPACGTSTIASVIGWNYTYTTSLAQIDDPLLVLFEAATDPRDGLSGTTCRVAPWYTGPTNLEDTTPGDQDNYAFYQISYLTDEGETATNGGSPPNTAPATPIYQWFPPDLPASNCSMVAWDASALDARVTKVRIWRSTLDAVAAWVGQTVPSVPDANGSMRLLAEVDVATGFYVDKLSDAQWAAQYAGQSETSPTTNTTQSTEFTATTPIYGYTSVTTGIGCYGYGCLEDPMAPQLQDPNPLADIETGYTPPTVFTSNQTVQVSCDDGFVNLSDEPLAIESVSSSIGPPLEHIIRLTDGAAVVRYICWPTGYLGASFTDLVLEGSNDGSTWTELFSTDQLAVSSGLLPIYLPDNATAYEYYRLEVTASYPAIAAEPFVLFHPNGVFGVEDQTVSASAYAESEISQQHADQLARDLATDAAQALLNCAAAYTATVSYTAHCEAGTYGQDKTVTATAVSLVDASQAQHLAEAIAKESAEAQIDCEQSNNETLITIPDHGKSSPFSTVKFVEGETGVVASVTLHIYDFKHTSPDDVHIVLMSPDGTAVCVMRNCGGVISTYPAGVDLDIKDGGSGGAIPDAGPLVSGEFAPTQNGVETSFPSPAPSAPYDTAMSAFVGESKNGAWSLWVYDDSGGDAGALGGWDIDIT